MSTDRSVLPTEHLPNSYVSRRSTEAQALSAWTPPGGTLGELTDEARGRAATLTPRTAELRRAADAVREAPGFGAALKRPDVAIIAEVKRSSPSKGVINSKLDLETQVRAYRQGGAAGISILTEPRRFGGSNEDLTRARTTVPTPLLKKDFHVEVVQILEARSLGASAALVIARAVPPSQLKELIKAGDDFGIEILVEVRDAAELDLALSFGASLIGVNNRNLETLEIDPETSLRLLPLIPREIVAIAESGVKSAADVTRLGAAGADAVLVGSELSASANPEATVRSLTGVARTAGARKG
ncbi:MAG TPA: indole-3-glycerol phosphate synthase TrpC [Gemmatimonadaceae bacterium]|nr:indole-3-glycerol phosphate synthase TrpC [Gemmatimonadaceae bacterium]